MPCVRVFQFSNPAFIKNGQFLTYLFISRFIFPFLGGGWQINILVYLSMVEM